MGKSMKRILVLSLTTTTLMGCGTPVPISHGAMSIQSVSQNSPLLNNCSRLGPVNATIDRLWPAQSVYNASVWEAKNKAALMGADTITILNSYQDTHGLNNVITVQAVAFKCN